MAFMKKVYPTLDDAHGVTISDGDKGIANAHLKVFPWRGRFRCFEHKKANILQHTGLSARVRGEAIVAYRRCISATTESEFDAAWGSMPDEARSHFPEAQWPEFFPLKCKQRLHGWYTSSCAESENNTLATARSQDPFNALLTIVEQQADRQAKQQLLAIEHAAEPYPIMPGIPPAVVKLLEPTRSLADAMAASRTVKVDGEDHVYNVGRLSQASGFHRVALKSYKCCPLLDLKLYPCPHVCHVCSVAKLKVRDFAPLCHTERGWRAQLGLSALPPPAAARGEQHDLNLLSGNVRRERCPLPDVQALLKEAPKGENLQLVIAVRPGARCACARLPSDGAMGQPRSTHARPARARRHLCSRHHVLPVLQLRDGRLRATTRASAGAPRAAKPSSRCHRARAGRRTAKALAGGRARPPPARRAGWMQTLLAKTLLLPSEPRGFPRTGLRSTAPRFGQVTSRSPSLADTTSGRPGKTTARPRSTSGAARAMLERARWPA